MNRCVALTFKAEINGETHDSWIKQCNTQALCNSDNSKICEMMEAILVPQNILSSMSNCKIRCATSNTVSVEGAAVATFPGVVVPLMALLVAVIEGDDVANLDRRHGLIRAGARVLRAPRASLASIKDADDSRRSSQQPLAAATL